uniref:Squamosa promoter binding protein-like 3d n=1 Tax=Platanus acerifolia TaxID=140101 RepID=A0A0K2CK02_PLAAC|nr:squamosa promoter binding protein-like 3d [Platanus x hispanica]
MAKRSMRETMNDDDDYDPDNDEEQVETEEENDEEGEEKVEQRRKMVLMRASGASVNLHTLCCQADDCDADLGAAKRYHRRHRVCERHAKAAVVSVSGVDQRYCQQCSRFHEISQFDDTKRSCRKRLAGHNQRRRKTHSELQAEDGGEKLAEPNMKASSWGRPSHPGSVGMTLQKNHGFKHFQIR